MLTAINKRFFFLVLLTPIFWWLVLKPGALISEWARAPIYVNEKVRGVFEGEYLQNVNELRWNAFGPEKEEPLATAYYNKGLVLINESINFLTFLSPRFYFLSGSGEGFSPPGVEPIASPLFIFWLFGLVYFLKGRKFKPIYYSLGFAFLAFLTGQKTMAFLFPVAFIYLFIAWKGIEEVLLKKNLNIIYFAIELYSLYLLGRLMWIS
jgi:hypothetical protein